MTTIKLKRQPRAPEDSFRNPPLVGLSITPPSMRASFERGVGYVSGKEPFMLLGRVSADTGLDAMPDPSLTMAEMQPVAFAAKMALGKVLAARKRR